MTEASEDDRDAGKSVRTRGPKPLSRPPRPRPSEREGRRGAALRRGIEYLLLAALVAGVALLTAAVVLRTQADGALAAREADSFRPQPLPSDTPRVVRPLVSVVGDQTTAGSGPTTRPAAQWPTLVAKALGADVVTFASPGSGYAKAIRPVGATFSTQAAHLSSLSDVVVLFGGAQDAGTPSATLGADVTKTVTVVRAKAPNAIILIVGPVLTPSMPRSSLDSVRAVLRDSAMSEKVEWVDAAEWLSGAPALVSGAGFPTPAGHEALERHFAELLRPLVQSPSG